MSFYKMTDWVRDDLLSKEALSNQGAVACKIPMGVTAENVAERYGITREKQDQLAYQSHLKASKAQEQGLFKSNQQLKFIMFLINFYHIGDDPAVRGWNPGHCQAT